MSVREAAAALLHNDPEAAAAAEITNRTVMETAPDGRCVVAADSIAFGTAEDTDRNVLVTAGHTGRSAVPYLRRCRPFGFICSDGGRGMTTPVWPGSPLWRPPAWPAPPWTPAEPAWAAASRTPRRHHLCRQRPRRCRRCRDRMPCPQAASLLLNR